MDRLALREKLMEVIRKYKYVAVVLLLGVVLMALPEKTGQVRQEMTVEAVQEALTTSDELEQILSKIEGVGSVEVLLTEASGAETLYQTDEDNAVSSDSQTIRVETVIISDQERGEYGLVRRVDPPVYRGAVVVCEGADRPSVQFSVVNAVSNATGISADRITVLKMK